MSYIHTNPVYQASPYGMASLRPIAWSGQRRVRPCLVRVRRARRRTLGMTESSPGTQAGENTAANAANFIPVVGPAISAAIKIVGGFLAAHHAGAMAKEASSLNGATPQFMETIQQVMGSLNAGQLSPSAAISALQGAQAAYYSSVKGIIKKKGTCLVAANGLDPGKTDKYGCATSSDPCNAACCIGCDIIEPVVRNLTAIIQAGGGTYQVPATPANKDNPGIGATPSFPLSYNGAQGAGTDLSGTIFGLPSIDVYGGGALLLLLILMMR